MTKPRSRVSSEQAAALRSLLLARADFYPGVGERRHWIISAAGGRYDFAGGTIRSLVGRGYASIVTLACNRTYARLTPRGEAAALVLLTHGSRRLFGRLLQRPPEAQTAPDEIVLPHARLWLRRRLPAPPALREVRL